jgi:hypothetical protein
MSSAWSYDSSAVVTKTVQAWVSVPSGGPREVAVKRNFARDVYVNVVANLIAAAIVYVLGAAVGWFPANAWILSVAGVAIGGPILLVVGVDHFKGERIDRACRDLCGS